MKMHQLSIKISPSSHFKLVQFHAALCADPVRSLHGQFTLCHAGRVALYRALCQWRAAHPKVYLFSSPRQGRGRRRPALPSDYIRFSIQLPEPLVCLLDTYAFHCGSTRGQAFRDALDNGLML